MSARPGPLSMEEIEAALRQREPKRYPDLGRPAGVLVPLFEREGEPHVLLTRRTDALRSHAGQISFPGGKRDEQDPDLCATALRESQEEVGITPEAVRLVGALDDTPTMVTNYVISPYVGVIPEGYPFVPCAAEIAALLEFPLAAFLEPGVLRRERAEWQGIHYDLHFFEVQGHTVWGATARILHQLFEFLGRRPE